MIKENSKQKNDVEMKSLNEIMKQKKEKFMETVFPEYSFEQMRNFSFYHKLIDKTSLEGAIVASSIVTGMMVAAGLCMLYKDPDMAMVVPGVMVLICPLIILCTQTQMFNSNIFKIWKRKTQNENLLKNKMFEHSIVDDEVLKCFVRENSEEKLVKMLLEKESLTYKDIYEYSNKKDKEQALKDKEIRLTKAVKCL